MIGRLEQVCDRARTDARQGVRAPFAVTVDGRCFHQFTWGLYAAYVHAWHRERRRMRGLRILDQLQIPFGGAHNALAEGGPVE